MQFNQRMARMARLSPIFTMGLGLGASSPDGAVPATPILRAPTGVGTGILNFSWNEVFGATSYKVETSPDNSSWTIVAASQPGISWLDTTVRAITYVRVSAINAVGTSAASNVTSGAPYLVLDTFVEPDTTAMTAYTLPVSNGDTNWHNIEGNTPTITGNQVSYVSAATPGSVDNNSGLTDCTFYAQGQFPSIVAGPAIQILIRGDGTSQNYFLGDFEASGTTKIKLYIRTGGSLVLQQSRNAAVAALTTYTAVLKASATTITFMVYQGTLQQVKAGTAIVLATATTTSSSFLSNTFVGIRIFGDATNPTTLAALAVSSP